MKNAQNVDTGTLDSYSIDGELAFQTMSTCQFLHISRRTLYRWIESGKVESRKFDGNWIVRLSEINRLRKLRGLRELSFDEALELFERFNR